MQQQAVLQLPALLRSGPVPHLEKFPQNYPLQVSVLNDTFRQSRCLMPSGQAGGCLFKV